MGLSEVQEDGNCNGDGVSEIPLGTETKYTMVTSVPVENNEVLQNKKHQAKKYVFACAVFASLNSVLLGYDVGVMSGAIIFIQEDLNISDVQQEVLVGILSIVSLLGSLAGGKTSDAIGRKWTIGLAAVVFQTGGTVMAFAPSFNVLMIGRLVAGVGIGFGVMITPVYIAEISPAIARGSLTSFPEIFINFGILLGYISNYAFSRLPAHINWRVMLGIGLLPSVVIALALFVIPESPRWLVMQNRIEEARVVLLKITESDKELSPSFLFLLSTPLYPFQIMSNISMVEAKLPPGFRFHPRDEELVCDYLMKKLTHNDSLLMIDVDLNKCEPWDIPE